MLRIRRFFLVLTVALLGLRIATAAQSGRFDTREAKKVSDSFMADLVANRLSDASQQLKSSSLKVDSQILNNMLDSCGRPLEAKAENNGVMGDDISGDGRTIPALTFLYLCTRSDHKRYRFHVKIEAPDDGKYYVTSWGCGHARW